MSHILDRINILKVKNPNIDFTYEIQIESQKEQYEISFSICYDAKGELMIFDECDLYKVIYPLIYNPLFRLEIS